MPDPETLIASLAATPDRLAALVADLDEPQQRQRPSDGGWSIKEIVGHLTDAAAWLNAALYRLLSEDDPLLPDYDPEEYAALRDYQSDAVARLLGLLRAFRQETVARLQALRPEDWQRTGRHPRWGRLTVRELVERAVADEERWLAEIQARRERRRPATPPLR